MKKWSEPEKAMKAYFTMQVNSAGSSAGKKKFSWKQPAEQLLVIGLGALLMISCGQLKNRESHVMDRGIQIAYEMIITMQG